MYFRPLLIPTLITLPGIALGLALGIWQLERLEWKEGLIEAVTTRVGAPAVPLDEALALAPAEAEWRKVYVEGNFLHEDESYLFAVGPGGRPGLHVLTPLQRDGGIVLIDRGFVPEALRDPQTRPEGQIEGNTRVEGVLRFPQTPSMFSPPPDAQTRTWYVRDPEGIAAARGLDLEADVYIEADATPNPGRWPLGGQTAVSFPNNHLQYAMTWFGLALALLAVYLVYHHRQGRLSFSSA